MNRSIAIVLALLLGSAVTSARPREAQAPQPESPPKVQADLAALLRVVPGDALGALVLRDLKGLDAKASRLLRDLGIPTLSPLLMVKGMFEIVEGIEESGCAALVFLANTDNTPPRREMALIVPTTDRKKLLAFLEQVPFEPSDGEVPPGVEILRVKMRGQDAYLAARAPFTLFAPSLSTLRRLLGGEEHWGQSLGDSPRRLLAEADIAVLLNGPAASAAVVGVEERATINRVLGGGPEALDRLVWAIGRAKIEPDGVSLGWYVEEKGDARPRHEEPAPARRDRDRFVGLPAEDWVFVFDVALNESPEQWKAVYERLLALLVRSGRISAELPHAEKLLPAIADLAGMASRASVGLRTLPEGPDGLFAITKILHLRVESTEFLRKTAEFVETARKELSADPALQPFAERLAYKPGAETLAGKTVDHLLLEVSSGTQADEAALKKVVGRDGFLVRLAAVGDHTVVATVGGGSAAFEQAAELARNTRAPLNEDADIRAASGRLPEDRTLTGFVRVDALIRLVREAARVSDRPVRIAAPATPFGAPVTITRQSVGRTATDWSVFLPTGTIVGVKTATMESATGAMGNRVPVP
jgi:hypothetical protein